ncbi:hypothetical protein LEMLEM_LOCUS25048 [Lemmus lemmus]
MWIFMEWVWIVKHPWSPTLQLYVQMYPTPGVYFCLVEAERKCYMEAGK